MLSIYYVLISFEIAKKFFTKQKKEENLEDYRILE